MIRLYTPESARHWKRRAALLLGLAIGLVVLALVVNIVLCTQVNTANAQTLQVTCIALFTQAESEKRNTSCCTKPILRRKKLC